jgi:UDP-GlcNAc:undecaprenyl-phosphate/decaprenyl-phosphate GlcNAc-1-phosphate transferase
MAGALIAALTFVAAALSAAVAVPLITALATRWRLLDYPDGDRHLHDRPVPRLGGVAVFVGLTLAISLSAVMAPVFVQATPWAAPLNRALLAGSAILFVVGLLDDVRGVSPVWKLVVQTVAAALVLAAGFRIDRVSFIPGWSLSLGVASIPVTVLWLVGVSNAFNLVDGLDGLAGGVGVIAAITIGAAATILGSVHVPMQAMALAGALIGFLYYNKPPARIFLGDSGSLVVGFLLAFISVRGSSTGDGVLQGLIPLFALSYLLLDTGIAMLRRWLRGAPLSRADDRHIHHQLLALGQSPRRAVVTICGCSAIIATLGLCVTFVSPQMTLIISGVGVAALLLVFAYGVRRLEYHEFVEASASLASGMRKARVAIQDRILARDVARLIQRVGSLEQINDIVRSHAMSFRFVDIQLLQNRGAATASVHAPDHIGSATWLLEYPIPVLWAGTNGSRATHTETVLAIWSAVSPVGRPTNPERVARILAPAISVALASGTGPRPQALAPESRLRTRTFEHHQTARLLQSDQRRSSSDAAPNL